MTQTTETEAALLATEVFKSLTLAGGKLTLKGFLALTATERLDALNDVGKLLKSGLVVRTSKGQLVGYLKLLEIQVWVSEEEKGVIAQILADWNYAPI